MAKKKGKPQQTQKKFSVNDYMRTRMRSLPMDKCYMLDDAAVNNTGETTVLVVRRHPAGTFSMGAFLVDIFCTGVKDTYYQFSISEDELNQILDTFNDRIGIKEVPYDVAHNYVYGGLNYAAGIGIEPHPDFKITQYILNAEDEAPKIDIEFGHNGRPALMCYSKQEIDKYERMMSKVLAPGEYDVVYLDPYTEDGYFDDELEYIDEDDEE